MGNDGLAKQGCEWGPRWGLNALYVCSPHRCSGTQQVLRCTDTRHLEPDTHQTHRFHTHAGSHTEAHAVVTQNCFPESCRFCKGGDLGEMKPETLQPETLVCSLPASPGCPVHLTRAMMFLFPL